MFGLYKVAGYRIRGGGDIKTYDYDILGYDDYEDYVRFVDLD